MSSVSRGCQGIAFSSMQAGEPQRKFPQAVTHSHASNDLLSWPLRAQAWDPNCQSWNPGSFTHRLCLRFLISKVGIIPVLSPHGLVVSYTFREVDQGLVQCTACKHRRLTLPSPLEKRPPPHLLHLGRVFICIKITHFSSLEFFPRSLHATHVPVNCSKDAG